MRCDVHDPVAVLTVRVETPCDVAVVDALEELRAAISQPIDDPDFNNRLAFAFQDLFLEASDPDEKDVVLTELRRFAETSPDDPWVRESFLGCLISMIEYIPQHADALLTEFRRWTSDYSEESRVHKHLVEELETMMRHIDTYNGDRDLYDRLRREWKSLSAQHPEL